jgi:L-ribulose-5-phosphate 3-epimerase
MLPFRIGVLADSFRLPMSEALHKAKEVGAEGVQVYAVRGEMSAEEMDAAARKAFRKQCDELGLEISALCGDLGGHGFQLAADNVEKVERSKRIVDLAVDVGTAVVTTHIGVVPGERDCETYRNMLSACRELGEYASSRDVTFAIETGPEPARVLRAFLDDVGSRGIGVNMDPANLVMVVGDDPVEGVRILRDYIVHTHAKDGVQLRSCEPEKLYDSFAGDEVPDLADTKTLFREVPLGEGGVQWDAYLKALQEIGFEGFLTIEREVGDDPEGDIRAAVGFLREKIAG